MEMEIEFGMGVGMGMEMEMEIEMEMEVETEVEMDIEMEMEVVEMDVEVEVEVKAGLEVEADVGAELELALEAEARAAAAEAEARAKAREVATALIEAEAASPAALRVCSSRCTLLSEVLAAAIATGGGAEGGAGCHLLGLPPSTLQAEQTKVVVGARLQAEAETALVPAMECPAVGAAKAIETAEATETAEAVEATEATNASISSAAAEPDCLTPMQAPPVPSPSEVAPSSPPQTHLSSRLGPRWVSTVSPWQVAQTKPRHTGLHRAATSPAQAAASAAQGCSLCCIG